MDPIDLGISYDDSPVANPSETPKGKRGKKESKKYYPSLYVSDVELGDLPTTGKMEVEYTLVSTTRDHKTEKCSATIEIQKILSVESGDSEEDDMPSEAAVDELLDKAEEGDDE